MHHTLDTVYVPLKITYGLVPLLAGLDKFTGILADWEAYIAPAVRSALPLDPATFMKLVGVIEIAVGLMILTRFTRLGAHVAMGWLVLISINLILGRFFDIAVRDLTMAVGAYTLGALATLKGLAWLPGAPRREEASIHAPTAR